QRLPLCSTSSHGPFTRAKSERNTLFSWMPRERRGIRNETRRLHVKSYFVRQRAAVIAGAGVLALLAACEDKRMSQLDTGITRDSAVTVLAQKIKGSGSDSEPNVYTKERYLIAGKTYEVLYFTPNNEKIGKSKDTLAWGKLTPLVFVENKLVAKGWPGWDSIATAHKIAVKKHQP